MAEQMSALPQLALTFGEEFRRAAERHGERAAYLDASASPRERVSFGEWYRRADGLAALVERGVRPGDVVAILLPSSIDYAIAYSAIVLAGGVATGVNLRLGEREVTAILDRAAPVLAVVDRVAIGVRLPSKLAVLDRSQLTDAYDRPGLGPRQPHRDPTDATVIIWTSGTTGLPKGAWFDHRNLAAAVTSGSDISQPYDVKLANTPFPHAGYMAKIWEQLWWGTTFIIGRTPWSAGDTLRLLVEERVTYLGAVPTQWAKLLEETGIAAADLSCLRIGVAAAAPAPPDLIERVERSIGCPLVVRFSMTESPSATGTDPDDSPDVHFRTVGRPRAGMDVELVDADGRRVSDGEIGRIRLRGPCVMRGYWRDPELTASVLSKDGWLLTSDLGRLDVNGNLVLAGRVNDMYIRGGYNVHPLEVEQLLAAHPDVVAAAVVGSPAPVIGEIGVAFVVPVGGVSPPSLAQLRSLVSAHLADYATRLPTG